MEKNSKCFDSMILTEICLKIIVNFEAQYMYNKYWDVNDSEFLLTYDHKRLAHYNDVTKESWCLKLPQTPLFDQQFV